MNESISLVVGPEAIAGYKRLPYKQWYALAEFIDNTTQAYFDNKTTLDPILKSENEPLTITIVTDNNSKMIRISDNAIGMSPTELQNALTIGKAKGRPGRSKYGYGMKTAAGWFGNNWKITTKKLGSDDAGVYELDMDKFIAGKPDGQKFSITKSQPERHFTTIEISNLQRSLSERMIRSIKEHLSSMYRRDIRDGVLRLVINEEELSYSGYKDEVWMKRIDGTSYKSDFHFTINGKDIKGWVGVLGEGFGGRGKGGFAILQNNRCILSEETMWKHQDIYGKEGSTVPQRLVGEIEADGFEVNTQKDDIDWHGTEEEDLAKAIRQFCVDRDFIKVAGERFEVLQDQGLMAGRDHATDQIAAFFARDDVSDAMQIIEVPDPSVKQIVVHPLEETAITVEDAIAIYLPAIQKTFHVKYVQASVNDPYYTYQILKDLSLLVIINENHPCVSSLAPNNPHFVHLRHCLFDAIAQWQCQLQDDVINPDSVFMIKDRFLRLNPLKD